MGKKIVGKMVPARISTGLALATLVLGCAAIPNSKLAADEPTKVVAPVAAVVSAPVVAAAAPPAGLSPQQVEQGRTLFNDWSCSSCHSLKDAGAVGHIGPSFDGNKALSKEFVIGRVTNGQGAMPGFGGQLTDEEIALLASYLTQVAIK